MDDAPMSRRVDGGLTPLSPDALLVVSASGTIVLVNPPLLRLLGCPPDEQATVVGHAFAAFVAPQWQETCRARLAEVVDERLPALRMHADLVRLDGQAVAADITIGYLEWQGAAAAQIAVRAAACPPAEEALERALHDLTLAYDATLAGLVRVLDLRSRETENHTYRVTEMTVRLARALGVVGEDLEHMRRGALLHDIGKMGVPEHILLKSTPLNEEEWHILRQHPRFACEWLSGISYLRPALAIPCYHHEQWDGGGYPYGLRGEDIPLAARIFAVVDVWDSMRSERPYRAPLPEATVRERIRLLAGSHFEPRVVDAFLALHSPFDEQAW